MLVDMALRPALGLAVSLAAAAAGGGCDRPGSGPPPNVLLVTLDTTRADRLGCYGYARATSPHLDALAAESILFVRALATSSWTLPSHASLFTGKFPTSHGARLDPDGPLVLADAIAAPAEIRARGLAPGEATLAQRLAEAGWATAAVVGGPWLLRPFGLAKGFAVYDDAGITDQGGRRADAVTDAALRWLDAPREGPFFLFLNYFDPHFPYDPPEPFASAFMMRGIRPDPSWRPHFEALYDAEILFMDAHVGRLLEGLRARGLWDATLIAVTSDHGELLGEHGEWGHRRSLHEELLRIPLLVKPAGPPRPGRRDESPVQILDLHALILEAAGLPLPEDAQGQAPPRVRHPILAEVTQTDATGAVESWQALWEGRFKTLRSSAGHRQLFDLEADPGERANLLEGDRAREREAMARLEAAFAALPPAAPAPASDVEVPAEARDALERLGYLE
jgi:arylsulfatase A-like enzyme